MERQNSMNISSGGVEGLREEQYGPASRDFSFETRPGPKLNVETSEQRPRAPSFGDILVLSPKLNVGQKKKPSPEKTKYGWTVGDRVVAYISTQGCWKDGVVHEVRLVISLLHYYI